MVEGLKIETLSSGELAKLQGFSGEAVPLPAKLADQIDRHERSFWPEQYRSLAGALPSGYTKKGMGRNDEVDALLSIPVIGTHSDLGDTGRTRPKPWTGPEKVCKWYELENGKKVGWVIDAGMDGEWKFIVRD